METLKQFKEKVTIGFCVKQWTDEQGTQYEMYNTRQGSVIIQIYKDGNGWDVFKSCPFVNVDKTIEWATEDIKVKIESELFNLADHYGMVSGKQDLEKFNEYVATLNL